MSKPLGILVALFCLGLLLAACGQEPLPPAVVPSPVTPAAPAESATPALTLSPVAPSASPPAQTATVAPTSTPAAVATATATAVPATAGLTPAEPLPTATSTLPPPAATATPLQPAPTAAPPPPLVRFFRVTPATTLNLGDALVMTWKAAGDKAELCPISGPGPLEARCRQVPLEGSSRFVTDEGAMAYTGFGLRVTSGGTFTWSLVDVHLQCRDLRPWFFANAPERCAAAPPQESYAAGQYFERGLMVWLENPDSFYVFYRGKDEQGFQTLDWISTIQRKPDASPDHRVGAQPPAGLYEPVSGFGMVWRGEIEGVRADVRERLGWATAPESGFQAAYQCETVFYPGLWDCFLRGPQGEVLYLRPDSTAQVRWLWEEWQTSP